ncbi:MAG: hypothetical protein GY796_13750 [Chloroflexi bacterium]|nr:hypothetical protein [Chloroflexota bacterium]
MSEIHVETKWDDSGYDCDHCGGRILKRIDQETGRKAEMCYQCEVCGCQWTLAGDVSRIGRLQSCRQAQRERRASRRITNPYPVSLMVLAAGGGLLLLILIYLGGLVAVRFLIPIAIAVFVAVAVFRFGRKHMWW